MDRTLRVVSAGRGLRLSWWPAGLLVLLIAAPLLAGAAVLGQGTADFGIAGLFSTDEELSGRIVWNMLHERTLSPGGFFAYGALYHEVAALVALPLALDGFSEQEVLLALRVVALASMVATLALTFLLGQRLYGVWAGLLASALLLPSTELWTWSLTAHPDTLQLALLTGGLLVVVRLASRYRMRDVLLVGALAGLAFGTKYGGIFLLPLVALAGLAGVAKDGQRTTPWRLLVRDGVACAVVFVLTFVVTNPYVVPEWRRWLTQVQAEVLHAQSGHVYTDTASAIEWVRLLGSVALLGVVGVILTCLGVGRVAVQFVRRVRAESTSGATALRQLDGASILALWVVGWFAYLATRVGYDAPRYALPLLPAASVLAAGVVRDGAGRLRPHTAALAGVGLLGLGLVALPALGSFGDLLQERWQRDGQIARDPRVEAGRWLATQMPADAVIVRDAYSYLPPSFSNVTTTFGLTTDFIGARRPDVIIVNEAIRGRFRDPALADRYVDGVVAYEERMAAYRALEGGTLACYDAARAFGPVTVYLRETGATTQGGACTAAP